ncbi:unnamed protein product [Toxocara canis]|uniref:MFS domain-containing protein n=1 Tax=Toxocara canis TaxID=6265 RepID=A0A183U1U8_TOXCA|nr:unnamed protein product [Toxocara canis]
MIAAHALGGILGSMAASSLADKYGRKATVFLNNIWATIGAVLMMICYSTKIWYFILLARLVFGFNAGITSVLVPVYLTELSPDNLRGTIGTCHQLFISFAILVADVFSFKGFFGSADKWQQISGVSFLPLILLKFCPESPHFSLLFEDDETDAEAALNTLRGTPDVQYGVKAIKSEILNSQDEPRAMLGSVFSNELSWATTLSVFLMYRFDVIVVIGLTVDGGFWAVCGLLFLSVFIAALPAWLVDSSCFGRPPLLLIGIFGMFFSSVAVVLALVLIVSNYHLHSAITASYMVSIFNPHSRQQLHALSSVCVWRKMIIRSQT